MIIIEKLVLIFLTMGIIPLLLGNAILVFCGKHTTLKVDYVFGWLSMLAIFEIVVVPATFANRSLSEVSWLYSVILVIVIIVLNLFSNSGKKNQIHKKIKFGFIPKNFYGWLALILLGGQLLIALFGVHMDADDAYYIGTATTSLSTDTLFAVQPDKGFPYSGLPIRYAFSGITIFWAYLSKMTEVHPLIIAHTIIPIIFISVSYILWWEIGKKLFTDERDRCVYFMLLNIINIYGNTSVYTQSSFLLFRIWQGKSLLPNIILPALLLLFLEVYKEPKGKIWGLILMVLVAACCCSSLAVPLGGVVTVTLSLTAAFFHKNWKLVVYGGICCIPCLIIGVLYLVA